MWGTAERGFRVDSQRGVDRDDSDVVETFGICVIVQLQGYNMNVNSYRGVI